MNEVDTAFVVLEDGATLTVPTALAGKVINQIRVGYMLEGGVLKVVQNGDRR